MNHLSVHNEIDALLAALIFFTPVGFLNCYHIMTLAFLLLDMHLLNHTNNTFKYPSCT
jgi:hypothetical protein